MKDIARLAQVSLGTVSNVLNDSSTVREINRKKVLDACKALDYRPNNIARTLKTRSSRSIGFTIPDIRNPFFPEVAVGAENTAKMNGYTLHLCNTARTQKNEQEFINSLLNSSVDGIILFKTMQPREVLLDIARHCCLVLIDYETDNHNYGTINVDEYNGITTAMQYLYDNGHRRIAFINGMATSYSSRTRESAYMDFLKKRQLPFVPEYVKNGTYTWESGYRHTADLMAMDEPPTALCSSNDLMAIGAIKCVLNMGLSVPGNLSIIGYDDIEMASLYEPMLTTIRQPKYEMGELAVKMILEAIDTHPREYSTSILNTSLQIRQTVRGL